MPRQQRQHRGRIDAAFGRVAAGEQVDVERPLGQRADFLRRFGDLRRRQIGRADRAERARIRYRGDQFGRREAAAHRSLDDRMRDPEPFAGNPLMCCHLRPNLLSGPS